MNLTTLRFSHRAEDFQQWEGEVRGAPTCETRNSERPIGGTTKGDETQKSREILRKWRWWKGFFEWLCFKLIVFDTFDVWLKLKMLMPKIESLPSHLSKNVCPAVLIISCFENTGEWKSTLEIFQNTSWSIGEFWDLKPMGPSYLPTNLPYKSTIHVSKYTVRPMDTMGNQHHNKNYGNSEMDLKVGFSRFTCLEMCGSQYSLKYVLNQAIGSASPIGITFIYFLCRYHIKMVEHHGIVWYYFMDKTLLTSWYRKCASYTVLELFFCPLFWGSFFQTPNKIQSLTNTNYYSCSILKHAKTERELIPGKVHSKPQRGSFSPFCSVFVVANLIEVYISLMHSKNGFCILPWLSQNYSESVE